MDRKRTNRQNSDHITGSNSDAVPEPFINDDLKLEFMINANREYTKLSYPVKYGQFSRLTTPDFIFEFNRNHEITHARSKRKSWLHPQEWLKRTAGNDWVYYSTGGYAGVFEAIGEYYLPNLTYPTNSLLGGKPFLENEISHIVNHWHDLLCGIDTCSFPSHARDWFAKIVDITPERLSRKAAKLIDIIGARVSVMPPDARHVDYHLIPIHICDGCLYKCRFCRVKNKKPFFTSPFHQIEKQINALQKLFNRDLTNYNALFLGEHDALNASKDIIFKTAMKAYDTFGFERSYMKERFLFLFGSADSLLNKQGCFFEQLNALPFKTFINIGLESTDQRTLDTLGKPLTTRKVISAFEKIQEINQTLGNIEISCNFVMGKELPDSHFEKMMDLIRHSTDRTQPKGTVYLSPLSFGSPSREILYDFYRLKSQSRFPTFLYLIQRL